MDFLDEMLDRTYLQNQMTMMRNQQQQRQGGMGMHPGIGSVGGQLGGGESAAGPYAAIAAIIAAQHIMAMNNNRTFEGQRSGDVFTGDYATEPWLAFLSDRIGLPATAGEQFDAAIKNRDWNTAAKRFPEAADYWADPLRGGLEVGLEGRLGEDNFLSKILNPVKLITSLFD